jgi:hypothetical protein
MIYYKFSIEAIISWHSRLSNIYDILHIPIAIQFTDVCHNLVSLHVLITMLKPVLVTFTGYTVTLKFASFPESKELNATAT